QKAGYMPGLHTLVICGAFLGFSMQCNHWKSLNIHPMTRPFHAVNGSSNLPGDANEINGLP
ncbi:MAG: hypothetical protein J5600_03595, partial [Desulfovibrio sp.]|nr:hypothetical protein [Desulfovibrio sp.]